MFFFRLFCLGINILLILLILIRSPNEQSLQERLGWLNDSSLGTQKKVDQLIQILIFLYFLIGFFYASKAF